MVKSVNRRIAGPDAVAGESGAMSAGGGDAVGAGRDPARGGARISWSARWTAPVPLPSPRDGWL